MKCGLQLFIVLLVLTCSGSPTYAEAQAIKQDEKQEQFIGVATMEDDSTIVLLRAKSPHGGIGEGTLVYPPTHPDYQNILSHIGSIRKGQTVPVKPWPD